MCWALNFAVDKEYWDKCADCTFYVHCMLTFNMYAFAVQCLLLWNVIS